MFAGFRDAAFANSHSLTRGKHNVHHTDVLNLLEDASRFVARAPTGGWSGPVTQAGQRLPQHVRQEADQDVCQHAVLFLVPDGADAQVAFVNPERGRLKAGLGLQPQKSEPNCENASVPACDANRLSGGFGQLDVGLPQF